MRHIQTLTSLAAIMSISTPVLAADFEFATSDEAVSILTAQDEVLSRFGALEIGVRLQSETDQSMDSLIARFTAAAMEYTDEEKARINALLEAEAGNLALLEPLLPETIYFIRTDASIDGGFPHTRANAIVYPGDMSDMADDQFRVIFYHELYHVLSRHNAEQRDEVYALLSYQPCVFEPPADLYARRLTNPDAPVSEHYIPLLLEAGDGVLPYLYLPEGGYSASRDGGFGSYFGFGLIAVDITDGRCDAVMDDAGEVLILDPGTAPGFLEAIGRNTGYIIHPEETMADNFVLWMTGGTDMPNPEIVERVRDWHTARADALR